MSLIYRKFAPRGYDEAPPDQLWSFINARQAPVSDRMGTQPPFSFAGRAERVLQAVGFLDRRRKGETRSELERLTITSRPLACRKRSERT